MSAREGWVQASETQKFHTLWKNLASHPIFQSSVSRLCNQFQKVGWGLNVLRHFIAQMNASNFEWSGKSLLGWLWVPHSLVSPSTLSQNQHSPPFGTVGAQAPLTRQIFLSIGAWSLGIPLGEGRVKNLTFTSCQVIHSASACLTMSGGSRVMPLKSFSFCTF